MTGTRLPIGGPAPALVAAPAAPAAPPSDLSEQLRRIFASAEFAPRQRFGPARWIENGAAYLTLEPSTVAGARDLVRYESATGARTIMGPASRLGPEGAAAPLDLDDYSWSADGARLLIFTNSQRVWRQNTRGDCCVPERASGRLPELGGPEAPASSLMYAKFSPSGDRVAYVRQGEVYVERLADGQITRLPSAA